MLHYENNINIDHGVEDPGRSRQYIFDHVNEKYAAKWYLRVGEKNSM